MSATPDVPAISATPHGVVTNRGTYCPDAGCTCGLPQKEPCRNGALCPNHIKRKCWFTHGPITTGLLCDHAVTSSRGTFCSVTGCTCDLPRKEPCRNGQDCPGHAKGKCWFTHEPVTE